MVCVWAPLSAVLSSGSPPIYAFLRRFSSADHKYLPFRHNLRTSVLFLTGKSSIGFCGPLFLRFLRFRKEMVFVLPSFSSSTSVAPSCRLPLLVSIPLIWYIMALTLVNTLVLHLSFNENVQLFFFFFPCFTDLVIYAISVRSLMPASLCALSPFLLLHLSLFKAEAPILSLFFLTLTPYRFPLESSASPPLSDSQITP